MRALFLVFLFTLNAAFGQSLQGINYSYLYSDSNPVTFSFQTVRKQGQWITYFKLLPRDTTQKLSSYIVEFELRKNLSDKSGEPVSEQLVALQRTTEQLSGHVTVNLSDEPVVLAARVINTNLQRLWYHFTILEPKYPHTTTIRAEGEPLTTDYLIVPAKISVVDSSYQVVSFYDDRFPPAALPFSEKLGAVSKGMRVDSSFSAGPGASLSLERSGLYLIQQDTMVSEGFAFRAESDYPRYSKLENIADPFIYICTSQEYSRIKEAKGDKRAFDRVILSITRDTDRAKKLIRSYFRRVEMANALFTSYKEGWKTDRGMMYIIFGPPNEVFRFNDREVWNYNGDQLKLSFDFVRSPSIFDPENFVLIRDKKYTQVWYEMIDLWRNARF